MLQATISDPRVRLIEIGASFLEARALHIVAEKRIPDLLAKEGKDGVGIEVLAEKTGLEALKLGEFMRKRHRGDSIIDPNDNRKDNAHPMLPARFR